MTPISDKNTRQHEDASEKASGESEVLGAETPGNGLDNGQRHELIAVAAYFIAERRQFQNGSPEDDWLQAEADIERQFADTRLAHSQA